jgi:putative colanic acid biosynthesis UDP-glucose lipid carrier transferase
MKKSVVLVRRKYEMENRELLLIPYSTLEETDATLVLMTPLNIWVNTLLKRSADLFISTVLILLVFSWLFPIMALLIKLDSRGPVFFLQKRTKRKGSLFTCIKFRTMIENSDADLLPAFENDPRITRLGKFLRNHHLDELPQLLNVWWGDMTLIGPRPHMISDNDRYEAIIDYYSLRHQVKPGITGLAQVKGLVGNSNNPDHMQERVEQDLYYIRNWSPLLDLKIICRTLWSMIG